MPNESFRFCPPERAMESTFDFSFNCSFSNKVIASSRACEESKPFNYKQLNNMKKHWVWERIREE